MSETLKNNLEKQHLGLKRGTVKLVPHNEMWAEIYKNETAFLTELFGRDFVAAEHIGSTAIKGILAKPVLDMIVAPSSLDVVPKYQPELEKIGYNRRDLTDNEHILFAKGSEENRTIYLKITTKNSNFWKENILFRDYLNDNKTAAEEYESLKKNLAKKAGKNNRTLYTAEKAAFIKEKVEKAEKFYK